MLKYLVLFLAVVAGLTGVLLFSQWRSEPLTVSGFIEADEIRVGSRVGGRVAEVPVEEGALVKAGDVILRLEAFDLYAQRTAAEARLAERKAEYERLQAGFRAEEIAEAEARQAQAAANLEKLVNGPRQEEILAARKAVEEASANLNLAKLDAERVERLHGRGAASQEELDRATGQYRAAAAVLEAREADLALLENGTRPEDLAQGRAQLAEAKAIWELRKNGFRREDIEKARAAVEQAQGELDAIAQRIEELTVRAPVNAVVEAVDLQPGDLVGANVPAVSLMDLDKLWVRAYLPENALFVRTGQKAVVLVDSYPGEEFDAHVSFVAREAEFTPRNVQTPEERSKQVFRIKVRLDEGWDRLRPGMSADVVFREPAE